MPLSNILELYDLLETPFFELIYFPQTMAQLEQDMGESARGDWED